MCAARLLPVGNANSEFLGKKQGASSTQPATVAANVPVTSYKCGSSSPQRSFKKNLLAIARTFGTVRAAVTGATLKRRGSRTKEKD